MRKCNFRNCKEIIMDKKENKKYCCKSHKDMENIYLNRDRNKLLKERIRNIIDQQK